jgi:formate-dependent nitrite reductase membrane component NrfD
MSSWVTQGIIILSIYFLILVFWQLRSRSTGNDLNHEYKKKKLELEKKSKRLKEWETQLKIKSTLVKRTKRFSKKRTKKK